MERELRQGLGLDAETVRVLRAAAFAAETFTAEDVAKLLDVAPIRVVERLQLAADAGVPVQDLGGRFRLDPQVVAELRATTLPSLAEAWQELLPASPEPEPDDRLSGAAELVDRARAQWLTSGERATLADAFATAEEAASRLVATDPPQAIAAVRTLVAGIAYDLGDPASLERALVELSDAMRILATSGDARGAARLLNDQAAVWVRLGDPVRAAHLLRQSREVFAGSTDPAARVEQAETDHLLARLPLHAPPRPGLEAEAIRQAMTHARLAAEAWGELRVRREVARVLETMGRLERLAGRLDEAANLLAQAAQAQQELGDLLGLARTSAALAEVLADRGELRDALAMLGHSADLNARKGSPIGLAYVRRSLEALVAGLDPRGPDQGAVRDVATRLSAAERRVGVGERTAMV